MSIVTPEKELIKKIKRQNNPIIMIIRNYTNILLGGSFLLVVVTLAIFAAYIVKESPTTIDADNPLLSPSSEFIFGTDQMGRSVFSRVIYGGRISILVGLSVAFAATSIGFIIGVISGFSRWADAVIMRIMDGLMAIPGILLAIALMSLTEASVKNVIIAVSIPEIPRVVRLIRSLVLSIREQLFVEAAFATGSSVMKVIFIHVLPTTLAPLAVQASYVCASAIINESYLSFLGAGIPPEISSWGGIMAEGRDYFSIAPWLILIPGVFIAWTVLSMNILGDGLRDTVDPRMANKI
jgi:peptide/nickel transport system permease protein